MPTPELSADEVLTTTRAVRRRLDFDRPVEPELIRECLEVALQAPTGGNNQDWHFVVVTEPETRRALGEGFRTGAATYAQLPKRTRPPRRSFTDDEKAARGRVMASAGYLFEHLQDVPVLVVACFDGRFGGATSMSWGRTTGERGSMRRGPRHPGPAAKP